MDHVNIISQKAITMMAPWASNIICILGFSMIFFLIGCLVYSSLGRRNKKLSNEKLLKVILYTGATGLCVLLILACIAGLFFRVPSGRYKYEATIDEENMTVAEYNEFMKAYNHSHCKDGIYHFEDWAE
jgi:hypothetical protein